MNRIFGWLNSPDKEESEEQHGQDRKPLSDEKLSLVTEAEWKEPSDGQKTEETAGEPCGQEAEPKEAAEEPCMQEAEPKEAAEEPCGQEAEPREAAGEPCGQNAGQEEALAELRRQKTELEEAAAELRRQRAEQEEALAELRRKKADLWRQMTASAQYELRRQEMEKFQLQTAREIRRRQETVDGISQDLRNVSRSLRESGDGLIREVSGGARECSELLQAEIRRLFETEFYPLLQKESERVKQETDRAINVVVRTSRRIQNSDFEDLLRAFQELQRQIYMFRKRAAAAEAAGQEVKEPGESLGLGLTSAEHFLRRFLRVLNGLGYRAFDPLPGAAVDGTMEAENARGNILNRGVVREVIASGFQCQEDGEMECVIPAQVLADEGTAQENGSGGSGV